MAEEDQPQLPKLSIMQTCPIDLGECKKQEEIEKEFNPSQVFLDIPYSGYKKEYEEAIRKAIESFGLIPVLAETTAKAEGLLCNVCQTIQKSGYAVADISEDNKNVPYELGIIHSLGKKCCILCNSDTKIPVDLAGLTLHKYENEKKIKKNVSKWISDNVDEIVIKVEKQKRILEALFYQISKKYFTGLEGKIYEIKRIGDIKPLNHDFKKLIDKLIDFLWDEEHRGRTTSVLKEIGDERAEGRLIEALKDEDYDVRLCAIDILGEIGSSKAVEPLIAILGYEDEYVRKLTAQALGMIGDTRAIEPLDKLLDDSPSVSFHAKKAIKKIKSTQRKKKKE